MQVFYITMGEFIVIGLAGPEYKEGSRAGSRYIYKKSMKLIGSMLFVTVQAIKNSTISHGRMMALLIRGNFAVTFGSDTVCIDYSAAGTELQ